MKRIFSMLLALPLALALTGCGMQQERLYQVDPADYQQSEPDDPLQLRPEPVDDIPEEPNGEYPEEPYPTTLPDFDSITQEDVLRRLENLSPAYYDDAYEVYIPTGNGDPVEELQADFPNLRIEVMDETETYTLCRFADSDRLLVRILKQFHQAGNGYAYYDGALEAEDVIENFSMILHFGSNGHDLKVLSYAYRDDPEIKCVCYDFYAVDVAEDGRARLGYYSYCIDREDRMFCYEAPDWNLMNYFEIPAAEQQEISAAEETAPPLEAGQAETITQADLDAMEKVDEAIGLLMQTAEWQQSDEAERKALAFALLSDLAERGLVIADSIYVPENNDVVSFSYIGGAGGSIKVMPFDRNCN